MVEIANMHNILTFDVEEHFQVSAFEGVIQRNQWDRLESRVEKNTDHILGILNRYGIKATFFLLGWVAERHPGLVKKILVEGHEIGSHGYSHRLVYEQSPEEFQLETRRSKMLLEDITGVEVVSYRAASYSITLKSLWALRILAEEGFRCDSSIFPIVHDRYGIPRAVRHPHRIDLQNGMEILEFPISTLQLAGARMPFTGGGYFRIFPYFFSRLGFYWLNKRERLPVIFYLHPWEFDPEQPRQKANRLSSFRHYCNLNRTGIRFERLIQAYPFLPFADFVKKYTLENFALIDLEKSLGLTEERGLSQQRL